jgi:hypothetical protein
MRPSARLLRAVTAERADLERQRDHLAREAADLRAALARIEQGMAQIDAQCLLLDRLAGGEASAGGAGGAAARGASGEAAAGEASAADAHALRGPAIRQVAVAVLTASGRDALHYREWYDLLVQQGHVVAGKDPLAVFLTQLSRSPVLRKGARPGHYELDRDAPARLKRKLDRLHREYLPAARAQRTRIAAEITGTEKQLEEAARLLEQDLEDAA